MTFDFSNARIFLRPGTTDMRTSKEELLHVINDLMKQDPFSGARWPWSDTVEQTKEIKLDEIIMLLKRIDFFCAYELL